MIRRVVLTALVFASIACGKRGDPHPPVPVIPQPTSDLSVTQRGDRIILSWSYPSLTTTGRPLPAVRRITVYRYSEGMPVQPAGLDTQPLTPPEPEQPQPIAAFAGLPELPKSQFMKLANKVETLESSDLGDATTGARLIFSDAPPFNTDDARPVRLTYAVVTEGEEATGDYSNLATIVPLPVAVPPSDLVAEAKPEGVQLTWSAPAVSVSGNEVPVIIGYQLYRTGPGEQLTELSPPITALVKETHYTDNPPYGEHDYRVAAVTWSGPPVLQSAPSAPAHATFRDLLPPPTPANLTTLIESSNIRLLWDAVDAPDLAGYKIYRYEGVGHVNIKEAGGFPLSGDRPIGETTWLDKNVALGIAFRYEVSAVDKSGNESARAQTGWVVAPKTP